MIQLYQPTQFELLASKLLKDREIILPDHLSIKNISNTFEIDVEVGKYTFAFQKDGYKYIMLDSNDIEQIQRKKFFHEFTHLNMHLGNQDNIHNSFRQLQENQADTVSFYFAIPYHMLHLIDFSSNNVVNEVSEMFNLPFDFVNKRLEKIKCNILLHNQLNLNKINLECCI